MILIVFGLVRLSQLKYRYMRIKLHAYDFIYYTRSLATLLYAIRQVRPIVRSILTPIAISSVLLAMLWIVEPQTLPRIYGLLFLTAAVAGLLFEMKFLPCREHADQFVDQSHLETFIASIREAIEAARRGGIMASQPDSLFASPSAPAMRQCCIDDQPNIIVILNESTFPPVCIRRSIMTGGLIRSSDRSMAARVSYGSRRTVVRPGCRNSHCSPGFPRLAMAHFGRTFSIGQLTIFATVCRCACVRMATAHAISLFEGGAGRGHLL